MRSLPLLLSSISLALLLACTKSESPPTADNTTSTASAPPLASSAPVAEPLASADPAGTTTNAPVEAGTTAAVPGGAADAGKATAGKDGKDGGAATAASSASAGAAECGTKPLPDCPLQAWMKKNMNPPSLAGDTAALATALESAAAFAPPGYTNWASISHDGAKAAKGGDLTAAKASCRSCHDQYKKKYQAEMRARKI
jgi:hypothetical protein